LTVLQSSLKLNNDTADKKFLACCGIHGFVIVAQGPTGKQYPETAEFNPHPLFKILLHILYL
jgi:hypothetical protein